jgi:hypothetical protein
MFIKMYINIINFNSVKGKLAKLPAFNVSMYTSFCLQEEAQLLCCIIHVVCL